MDDDTRPLVPLQRNRERRLEDDQLGVPVATGIHPRSGSYGTHTAERMPRLSATL